jgi:predicted dehydrogenase
MRVAVIGLGYWGPNYARVVGELDATELTWICDTSADALASVGRRFSARTTTELDEVFGAPDVDAVIVSTPTSTHADVAGRALDAGKHVLCEKPLAASVAECDELIARANAAGRMLFVGHTFIFNPAVRQMRELVEAGELGRLLYCHATRTGLGPIRQDVNALWDLAPHDLSILFYLFGREPVSVSATGRAFLREDVEDVVFANLSFNDGAIGAVHVSWLDPYKVRRVTAVGEERMVVFDDVAVDERLKVFDRGASYETVSESARGTEFGEYRAMIRDGEIRIPKVPTREPLKEQVLAFVRACESGEAPETSAVDGRRVVAVLEAATQSMRLGGAPVEIAAVAGAAA